MPCALRGEARIDWTWRLVAAKSCIVWEVLMQATTGGLIRRDVRMWVAANPTLLLIVVSV
jgi:hypothetical protein